MLYSTLCSTLYFYSPLYLTLYSPPSSTLYSTLCSRL